MTSSFLVASFALLGAVLALAAGFRARGVLELRSRLLELLALAAARGIPLEPLVARAAAERRGRMRLRLRRMHARLAEGAPLASACALAGRTLFPPHVLGAVRAAEGTREIEGALDAAAADATASLQLRHRWMLVAAYPAVVAVLLYLIIERWRAYDWDEWPEAQAWPKHAAPLILSGLSAAAGLALAGWLALRRLCVLEGPRLLAAERLLRALAPHVAAGTPLPEALRRAAPACGNAAMAAGARDAARELESGVPAAEALREIPLPPFASVRLRSAKDAARMAELHAALAAECARRYRDRSERMLRWVLPVALLVLGVAAAFQFGEIMTYLDGVRRVVTRW